jgi:hypothetical protein
MPIVKLPKNERRFLQGSLVRFVPVAPSLPVIAFTLDHNRKQVIDILLIPQFVDLVIYSFNSQLDWPNHWFEGSLGGLFYYHAYSRFIFFDPQAYFEGLSDPATVVTTFTCYGSFDGGATAVTMQFEMTVREGSHEHNDPYWADVAFLFQLPPNVYSVTDRTNNNTSTIIGSVAWMYDNLFYDTIFFAAAPKSQIAVGAVNAYAHLLNGSVSWSFDGWFFPAQRNNMFVLGISENNTSKNTFFIRYSPGVISVYWQLPSGDLLLNGTYSLEFGANIWQYWCFIFDHEANMLHLWVNHALAYSWWLNDVPVSAAVGQLYVGGRLANATDNYVGRIAAVRLTTNKRYNVSFDVDLNEFVGDLVINPPYPPFLEV